MLGIGSLPFEAGPATPKSVIESVTVGAIGTEIENVIGMADPTFAAVVIRTRTATAGLR